MPGLYGVVLLRALVDLRGLSSSSSSLLRVGPRAAEPKDLTWSLFDKRGPRERS